MKDYKKLFSNFWGYADQHTPNCWGCSNKKAVDIHHLIGRKMGGDPKNKTNRISNLIPLCRSCHTRTEIDKVFNEELKTILQDKIDAKVMKKSIKELREEERAQNKAFSKLFKQYVDLSLSLKYYLDAIGEKRSKYESIIKKLEKEWPLIDKFNYLVDIMKESICDCDCITKYKMEKTNDETKH